MLYVIIISFGNSKGSDYNDNNNKKKCSFVFSMDQIKHTDKLSSIHSCNIYSNNMYSDCSYVFSF